MAESLTTPSGLLVRIRDRRDAGAWSEFVGVYAPLVYGLARRHGMQDADAADLTQDVLRAVVQAMPHFRYDPGRGSFRAWLFAVARNQLRKWAEAARRQVRGSGADAAQRVLEDYPAPDGESAWWDREHRERLFECAAAQVRPAFRPATWQAFWQTAVENRDAKAVGAALGMSVGAVYIARSRVLARIKEQVRRLEDGCAGLADGSGGPAGEPGCGAHAFLDAQ
jgi:RNA polymerase sigma-70 factor (ECF subfamily)